MSPNGPDEDSGLRRLHGRLLRHWHWGRSQGFGRLIEEDQLDPFTRVPLAVRKWRWRRSHGVSPGAATPVYLVGLQRSGTNMLVHGLEIAPEFEVHNENDRQAFDRFRLRSDAAVAAIVVRSRHRCVLFKPLCDSHRVTQLLDDLPVPTPGRAIWAYRDVDARVRSAVAKFGDANLQALRQIAAGTGDAMWQAQGLSPATRDLLRSFDYGQMTAETAAALFWYARNSLFFELGLPDRPDVLLSSYDALVADPEPVMRSLCSFLDFPWRPELAAHIEPRGDAGRARPLDIDPRVRLHCAELTVRLDTVAREQQLLFAPAGD